MAQAIDTFIGVAATPRFEVFYAVQALQGTPTAHHLTDWRREMQRRLTPKVKSSLLRVAPSALMWPLFADALRDIQPAPDFTEMIAELREMKDEDFQRAVLSGVFKAPGAVDSLLSKEATLASTISGEPGNRERLLFLLGLFPFSARSASVTAFGRIVDDPSGYRDEVVNLLVSFWGSGFAETWGTLEPQMRDRARSLRQTMVMRGPSEFAKTAGLPITIAPHEVRNASGSTRVDRNTIAGIHVIPSAFNTAKLWAAYTNSDGRTRFFIPLLDTTLSPDTRMVIDPSLVFNALGDTTRYAIASTIARKPLTSVELARAFEVSKPTISHHVQVLRAAGLLEENHTENGTVLSLNRRVLERASGAAAREMFSDEAPEQTIRRTRIPNKS